MADIEALLVEREGYKRRGLKDRVAQVDAAIETLGVSVSDDPEPEQTEEPDDAPAGHLRRLFGLPSVVSSSSHPEVTP